MKKLTALLLVFILIVSVNATVFAAGESAGEAGSFASNEATTEVKLVVDTSGNMSATVPLQVTLAVAADGTVKGPSNYTITNKSVMPIKVTNVAINTESGFTTATNATGTKIGGITLTDGQGGTATSLSAWTAEKTTSNWNMTSTDNNAITLNFGGKVTGITQDITNAQKAFTIVFTIKPGING